MKPLAVILAGGLGTRLGPLTQNTPKSLVSVCGQPFIVHQLQLLRRNDITQCVLCVGHHGEQIREVVGNGRRWDMQVAYSFDGPTLLGTGGAIRQALSSLTDPFFVLYGDSYLNCDYQAVQRAFAASAKLGLMTVFRNDDLWDRSNVLFRNGVIERYDKRHRTPEMQHIDYGLGMFRRAAFVALPMHQPLDLANVYADLLAHGQLLGYEVTQRFYEIGSPQGLAETEAYLKNELHPTTSRRDHSDRATT